MIKWLRKSWFYIIYGFDMDEYWERFIEPQLSRLIDFGLSKQEIDAVFEIAFEAQNGSIVGQALGSRLAFFVDLIEAGVPVKDILAKH